MQRQELPGTQPLVLHPHHADWARAEGWVEGTDFIESRPIHTEKPWFAKVGRLNMLSGEPLGVYIRTPWWEWRVFAWGIGFL